MQERRYAYVYFSIVPETHRAGSRAGRIDMLDRMRWRQLQLAAFALAERSACTKQQLG